MADKEVRLIDANALKDMVNQEPTDGMYKHEIIALIDEQPTVTITLYGSGHKMDLEE